MQFFRKVNPELINILRWVGLILVSSGAIAVIFISPPNVEFTRQYYEFGLERIIFLLVLFTLLLRIKGSWGTALTFIFTLLLFALSLLYKWQTGDNFSTVGGLFPVRDAHEYYQGAQMIIYNLELSGTSTFRPMFTAFLATIMWITNGDLQVSLIVLVALNAIAVFLATFEVRRTLKNSFFSAIYLLFCYIFFRRFSGTLLTENLGFLWGNLALVFMLRSAATKKLRLALLGLFFLTIGLNARAGAFLILPVLALWIGITYRNARGFWRPFILGIVVVAIGMTSNSLLAKAIDSPSSAMFSNYSYTLYGLASGNKGWEQVTIDHPEAGANEIFELAFTKIKNNPILLLRGITGAYLDYFKASQGAFSFLLLKRDRNDILNIVLWSLSVAGLITAWVQRGQEKYSISLAFFAGILLSVGLVPPADSTMMRAYAATIPMSLYIVATSAGFISEKIVSKKTDNQEENKTGVQLPLVLSGFILIASFLFPVILKQVGTIPSPNTAVVCEPGKFKVTFVIAGGSSIRLNDKYKSSYIPNFEHSRFISKLLGPEQLLDGAAVSLLADMSPDVTLTLVRLVSNNSNAVSISANGFIVTKDIPQKGTQTVCVTEPVLGSYYFLQDGTYPPAAASAFSQLKIQSTSSVLIIGAWLIGLFVLIKSIRVLEFPIRFIPLVLLNTFFIASGILLLIHTTGLLPLAWEHSELDTDKVRNPDNFMYVYNLGTDKISDTKFRDYPAFIYEDGILLSQPHESQSLISEYGRGRYILREKVLFFSSSDNSDPHINKRVYTLKSPLKIRFRYQLIIFSFAIIGVLIHTLYFIPMLKNLSKETNPT